VIHKVKSKNIMVISSSPSISVSNITIYCNAIEKNITTRLPTVNSVEAYYSSVYILNINYAETK